MTTSAREAFKGVGKEKLVVQLLDVMQNFLLLVDIQESVHQKQ